MNPITVQVTINAPLQKVWECWTVPSHIMQWAFASDDWEAPRAENDVREGGRFVTRMQAKDGSTGFDFGGTYTAVKANALIEYDMDKAPNEDRGRHVKTEFKQVSEGVEVVQTFDPENENTLEMQRGGWQAILDNFKKYVEANK